MEFSDRYCVGLITSVGFMMVLSILTSIDGWESDKGEVGRQG